MNCIMSKQKIYDYIIECIKNKYGMLLNVKEIEDRITKSKNDLAKRLLKSNYYDSLLIRPEEVEYLINIIRKDIGEIDSIDNFPYITFLNKYPEYGDKFDKILKVWEDVIDWHYNNYGKDKPLGKEFIDKLSKSSNCSKEECDIFFILFLKRMNVDMWYQKPIIKKWDGIIKLSDLFESEKLPEIKDCYFDQRYIDYLAKNLTDLNKINWRQFEGMTAEYFKKLRFEVKIGKGRNDGGIDILAIDKSTNTSIIIQCKRYSKDVKIESVKALYFDKMNKKMDRAIMVTTSKISKGGKEIIAGLYDYDSAEYDEIVKWLQEMKTDVKF